MTRLSLKGFPPFCRHPHEKSKSNLIRVSLKVWNLLCTGLNQKNLNVCETEVCEYGHFKGNERRHSSINSQTDEFIPNGCGTRTRTPWLNGSMIRGSGGIKAGLYSPQEPQDVQRWVPFQLHHKALLHSHGVSEGPWAAKEGVVSISAYAGTEHWHVEHQRDFRHHSHQKL